MGLFRMEKIKVNTNRLKNDSDQVSDSITKMRSEMSKMIESVSQLDKMWDGPSSEAFAQVFQNDMDALSTLLDNLDKIYKYETTAKSKYDTCENRVSQLITGIQV